MAETYDVLKLENQLCFPLYACAKEIVRIYRPFLDEIGLTYTQYIAMMVLWEKKQVSVKELGEFLYLDSGTLTPVLKKLEQKGYIKRCRSKEDERVLIVTLTESGEELKKQAVEIPTQMGKCVALDEEEARTLYRLLYKILNA
ncbi:MAG: MarR family transcriptional regulator [Lachnospiraceae bacterium]|nr:MarR family transcriptional regulator [Lachnospiraceae bacterium]